MCSKLGRVLLMASCFTAATLVTIGTSTAQTKVKPGFNLFSVEQDKEIGAKSAAEVERQLPILHSPPVEATIDAIGRRLAAVAPGAKYTYQLEVVDASDVNAFALPGGYLYFNRGLIEAAKSEGQLAGVMAHEMAHVALRHGTNQASKAYLSQMGLGVLGGLLSKDDSSTAKDDRRRRGFGLNALFLKFSRTDEEQADIVGAQMMARAGYDPQDMVSFFETLRSMQSRDPSKVEQFFSSHPAPKDRAARIRNEMASLTIRPTAQTAGFKQAKSALAKMPRARSMQQIAQANGTGSTSSATTTTSSTRTRSGSSIEDLSIEAPSTTFRSFEQRNRFFRVDYPDNWRVYEPASGYGVTLVPPGGYVGSGGDENDLVYGVIINHYDPIDHEASERFMNKPENKAYGVGFVDGSGRSISRTNLAVATNDLINQIVQNNPNLKLVPDSQRTDSISGARRCPWCSREDRPSPGARSASPSHARACRRRRDLCAVHRTRSRLRRLERDLQSHHQQSPDQRQREPPMSSHTGRSDMSDSNSNFGNCVTAFAIGGLVGAGIALLLAPRSGRETRALLSEKSRELADAAGTAL
jgi:predicted Zn-dependent protease